MADLCSSWESGASVGGWQVDVRGRVSGRCCCLGHVGAIKQGRDEICCWVGMSVLCEQEESGEGSFMMPWGGGSSMFNAVGRPSPAIGGALYMILVFVILL